MLMNNNEYLQIIETVQIAQDDPPARYHHNTFDVKMQQKYQQTL